MSDLTIKTEQLQGSTTVVVFHLTGHLHGPTEKELTQKVEEAYEQGTRHVLLNLTELEVLSSAGLRAVQSIFKLLTPPEDAEAMRTMDGEPYKSPFMKLVCPNPQIYYILSITGFLQNIPLFNNMEDASASFQ